LEDLFKGYLQGVIQNLFCATLWRFLLALAGPTNNILFLKDSVKDILVYNWG